jgi:membrane-bound ClpP family serine protease
MSLIIALVVTAFILFFFEIFLPGGVLAVIGGMLLLTGSFLTYSEYGLLPALLLAVGGTVAALLLFFIEIRFIANTRFGEQLSLRRTISARLNPGPKENLAGQKGVALTTLAPTGKVEVNDVAYTAACEDGYLEKGTPVVVVRHAPFKLIVAKQ